MENLVQAFKKMFKEDRVTFYYHAFITLLFVMIFFGFLLPYAVGDKSVSGVKSLLFLSFTVYLSLIASLLYPITILLNKAKITKIIFNFIIILNTLLWLWLLLVFVVGLSDEGIRLGFGFIFILLVLLVLWFIKIRRNSVLKIISKFVVKVEQQPETKI